MVLILFAAVFLLIFLWARHAENKREIPPHKNTDEGFFLSARKGCGFILGIAIGIIIILFVIVMFAYDAY
jgi:hypothetical protein